jgi:hypothetical protein
LTTPTRRTPNGTRLAGVFLLSGQGLVLATYAALVIVPFVANGLHAESPEQVAGGRFDPKDLWPYNSGPLGSLCALAATMANAFTWILTAGLALGGVGLAVTRWSRLTVPGRLRIAVVVVLAVAFLAFQFSSTGHLVGRWMAD